MNIGPAELLVIILFAFIIVGPERLPKAAKSIGKALRKLRDTRDDIDQTLKDEGLDTQSLQEASRNPFLALEKIEKIASVLPVDELDGDAAEDAEAAAEDAGNASGEAAGSAPDAAEPAPDAGDDGAGMSKSAAVTVLSDIETFTERKARIAATNADASVEPVEAEANADDKGESDQTAADSGEMPADGDDSADGHA